MRDSLFKAGSLTVIVMGAGLCAPAWAGTVTDSHGNVGFDTAAECDAALRNGSAVFYKSFTHKPPLRRAGETSVRAMRLGDVSIPADVVGSAGYGSSSYAQGACDVGVGHRAGRDGVAQSLIGKYIAYSPDMAVNVYSDKSGNAVRVSMKQCDNWFGANFPRPLPAIVVAKPAAAPAPAPAPAPVVAPPPAPVTPAAAVKAATGGLSTAQMLGIAGAVIAVPLLLNHDSDSGTTGTTGTTGTR